MHAESKIPLAQELRPNKLDHFIGQKHLVGQNKPINLLIAKKELFSIILWGPAGCGKTSLAKIIADELGVQYFLLSGVSSKKDDLRKIVDGIEKNIHPKGTLVIIDEIHRFTKVQQDYLLPYIEDGTIKLIGATTENPTIEIITPLLSRCSVFILKQLNSENVNEVINKVISHFDESIKIDSEARDWLYNFSGGDARLVINLLENSYRLFKELIQQNKSLSLNLLKETLQAKHLNYDKVGAEHYNTISALIKSMRASDPDAAIYYLSRMIVAGEDSLYIARRLVIFASEDIGIANPTALVVANEVYQACKNIGYPECSLNLAHGVVYLARNKKDRSIYDALQKAQNDAKKYGNIPIPLAICGSAEKYLQKEEYSASKRKLHNSGSLLPEKLKGRKYF